MERADFKQNRRKTEVPVDRWSGSSRPLLFDRIKLLELRFRSTAEGVSVDRCISSRPLREDPVDRHCPTESSFLKSISGRPHQVLRSTAGFRKQKKIKRPVDRTRSAGRPTGFQIWIFDPHKAQIFLKVGGSPRDAWRSSLHGF